MTDEELKRIRERWADDLGLRLDACIHAGMIAQQVKAIREEAERAAERR